jgi:hypothetical protein
LTAEDVQPEVVESEVLPGTALEQVNAQVEKGLRNVPGIGDKLIGIWHDIKSNTDINDLILQNMQANQLHIQEAEQRYWEKKAVNQEYLNGLMEKMIADPGNGEHVAKYQMEMDRIDKEETRDRNHVSNLMKSGTTFAKEYRQCAMARKSSVDIGKVEKMKMLFVSAIHNHVHDEATLNDIATEIQMACLELFPVSSETDLGAIDG